MVSVDSEIVKVAQYSIHLRKVVDGVAQINSSPRIFHAIFEAKHDISRW
jgi:hypothetical protein